MEPLPLWLTLSLISPLFWAVVHVLDSWCVEEVFDAPWIGVVCSAITILIVLPAATAALLFAESRTLPTTSLAWCCVAGAAFMIGQVLYFYALEFSESGIVAAYWNLLPLLLLIVSFAFFGERLTMAQYIGGTTLMLGSVSFCLVDQNLKARWRTFWLMSGAACAQVVYFLIQQHVFESTAVYPAFVVTMFAMAASGLTPLLLAAGRAKWRMNWPRIRPMMKFLVLIESANVIAVGISQYAVSFGRASLVAAVEAAIPAYTFAVSLLLYAVFGKYGEEAAKHRLPAKLALVGVMVVGVWLVS